MQSFLLSNGFMQNFVVFVKHTKLCLFQAHKAFIIVKPWLYAKKKHPVYKNQGWEPIHQKYKANESKSRHNPKKKTKTNNQRNLLCFVILLCLSLFHVATIWACYILSYKFCIVTKSHTFCVAIKSYIFTLACDQVSMSMSTWKNMKYSLSCQKSISQIFFATSI
jgi:hypothetical protein